MGGELVNNKCEGEGIANFRQKGLSWLSDASSHSEPFKRTPQLNPFEKKKMCRQ